MFCSFFVFFVLFFLHFYFSLLFFCNNICPLGGCFVVTLFHVYTFCLFWHFAFLLYFVFLAGCTNSWRRRVFIFVLFVFFTASHLFTSLHLFTFFVLYELLYFSVLYFTVSYYFAFCTNSWRRSFLYFYLFAFLRFCSFCVWIDILTCQDMSRNVKKCRDMSRYVKIC